MTAKLPSLMDMLSQLVATPSVSSVSPEFDMGNGQIIDVLANWLNDLGFATEVMRVTDSPFKANLIATLGEGEEGLVLAGHTDTVPYDQGRWQHDPFSVVQDGDRLYGLGTSDMKGFLAIAVEAAKSAAGQTLTHPLVLLATADEESGMSGAKRLAELRRPKARYAVIGEPTGMVPVRMHKGVAMEALTLIGRSGHSSNPSLGVNALDGMHSAIGAIMQWREQLAAEHHNPAFEVAYPTLNLGHIHGGDNPNRICGRCELHFDMRLMPGMDMSTLRPQLEARLRDALAGSQLQLAMRSLDIEVPAFETPASARLVKTLEALSGYPARSVGFASEAPFLQRLGIETVILGPGDIEQAHQPDEFLSAGRIQPCLELLRELIRRFCLRD